MSWAQINYFRFPISFYKWSCCRWDLSMALVRGKWSEAWSCWSCNIKQVMYKKKTCHQPAQRLIFQCTELIIFVRVWSVTSASFFKEMLLWSVIATINLPTRLGFRNYINTIECEIYQDYPPDGGDPVNLFACRGCEIRRKAAKTLPIRTNCEIS